MMQSQWSDAEAERLVDDYAGRAVGRDLALRVYTSRLLGRDPKLVLHGGGNTSVKTVVKDLLDQEYRRLRLDAQACQRSMSRSPRLQSPDAWEETVTKAADDYRSGLALIDQLGAFGLLDPAQTGMLLAIRRGLIEETNATSTDELVLIDMAVVAYANAMRLQAMIGNTALILESEMFGQPTLRAKWKSAYGGRAEEIQGLAVSAISCGHLWNELTARHGKASKPSAGCGGCRRCGSSERGRSKSAWWRRDRVRPMAPA
jgi:hypothetical protein